MERDGHRAPGEDEGDAGADAALEERREREGGARIGDRVHVVEDDERRRRDLGETLGEVRADFARRTLSPRLSAELAHAGDAFDHRFEVHCEDREIAVREIEGVPELRSLERRVELRGRDRLTEAGRRDDREDANARMEAALDLVPLDPQRQQLRGPQLETVDEHPAQLRRRCGRAPLPC